MMDRFAVVSCSKDFNDTNTCIGNLAAQILAVIHRLRAGSCRRP